MPARRPHRRRGGGVDTRAEPRRPEYARCAAAEGCYSSLSLPFLIAQEEQVTGTAGTSFASYAAVAAGNLHAFRSARDGADSLRIALGSRAVIDQAKGILMERHKLTGELPRVRRRT